MYYANCEWYVDMGEHNKPLCERKSLRPAKCSECPVYIRSIEKENAKLRELMLEIWRSCPVSEDDCAKCPHRIEESDEVWCDIPIRMCELGIEMGA